MRFKIQTKIQNQKVLRKIEIQHQGMCLERENQFPPKTDCDFPFIYHLKASLYDNMDDVFTNPLGKEKK
jgi:hypothetical protein